MTVRGREMISYEEAVEQIDPSDQVAMFHPLFGPM